MPVIYPMLQFVFGIAILLVSTRYFVRWVERVSAGMRISPLVVGSTLVAIGTSLPELVVSLTAMAEHDSGLAIANVVGSNIVNICLVLPVAVLAGKLRIGTTKTQRTAWVAIIVTIGFLVLYALRPSPVMSGTLLLAVAALVTYLEYQWGITGRSLEDFLRFRKAKKIKYGFVDILELLGSTIGVVVGGILAVNATELLSGALGVTTTVLGLSLTAVATSLPELATSVFSQEDREDKLALGNILGSNIYNLTLVAGIMLFFGSWGRLPVFDVVLLIIVMIVLLFLIRGYRGRVVPPGGSVIFLLMFAAYMFLLSKG